MFAVAGARVAQDTLEAARARQRVSEEAAERVDAMSAASVTFRMEVLRERAEAHEIVVSQETEAAEFKTQLASLNGLIEQLRANLSEVQRQFDFGRVVAPIAGIVSTGLAHVGQSLVAGSPIAEILDPSDIFVDWYIPNERLTDPKVDSEVLVLFGRRRIPGRSYKSCPFPVCILDRSRPSVESGLRLRSRVSVSIPALRCRR